MKASSIALALMLISALVVSSISLAISATSRSVPEAQEHASIPPEAFTGLGSKKGVGFGDWTVNGENPNLTIFSYPAGSVLNYTAPLAYNFYQYFEYTDPFGVTYSGTDLIRTYYVYKPVCPGWDAYLVDMLMTKTVTMDTADISGRQVNITFYYLNWFWNRTYLEAPELEWPYQWNLNKSMWVEFDNCAKASTTLTIGIGSGFPQSVTFTGQIYLVTLTFVGTEGFAGGHYFVSADRRV